MVTAMVISSTSQGFRSLVGHTIGSWLRVRSGSVRYGAFSALIFTKRVPQCFWQSCLAQSWADLGRFKMRKIIYMGISWEYHMNIMRMIGIFQNHRGNDMEWYQLHPYQRGISMNIMGCNIHWYSTHIDIQLFIGFHRYTDWYTEIIFHECT